MTVNLEDLRRNAKRIECYAARIREKLWQGDHRKVVDALADTAELGEIGRRLYLQIQASLQPAQQHNTCNALRDEPE
jgi:hypothetical protein